MIHYTQIIWEEVAFIWKVTGKSVAIFMTGTVHGHKLFKMLSCVSTENNNIHVHVTSEFTDMLD